jgi:hypothetical protein
MLWIAPRDHESVPASKTKGKDKDKYKKEFHRTE